jgi:DNA-binding beta-propeller fold protein YncE
VLIKDENWSPGDELSLGESPTGRDVLAGVPRGRRRLPRVSLAALFTLCVLAGWLWLAGTPALALSQRGHAFSFSFGAAGKGEGQFLAPSAVAVNDSNGSLYVADRLNNRVEQFEPQLNASAELVGERFVAAFKVPNAEGIAVDNSSSSPSKGDVYVAGTTAQNAKEPAPEDKLVYKFTAGGTLITKLKKFKPTEKKEEEPEAKSFETIEGVAVDSSGNLFVYDEEGIIFVFNNAEQNVGRFRMETPFVSAARGLGLDAEGNLYVGHVSENPEAAGAEGAPAVIGKLQPEAEPLIEELDRAPTTAVAANRANVPSNQVSELNDAYINNVSTVGGEKVTTVAAFDPAGSLIQRFGAPGLREATGIAVSSSSGVVYVTDAASDKVDVFALEPPGRPKVDSLSSCLGSTSPCTTEANAAKLNAQVNPVGADTHAYFEYGSVSCAAVPGSCTKSAEADLGEGFGDQSTSVELQNLQAGTYHYRVVARNRFGTVFSAERTFTVAALASGLPDGRAWEMVSPPNKDGFEAEPIVPQGGTIQAAKSGSAMTYVTDGPIPAEGQPEGNRYPEQTQIISARGANGWASQDIVTANSSGGGAREGSSQEFQLFSPNLALSVLQPFIGTSFTSPLAEPPLSPPLEFESEGKAVKETEQEKTIYLRDNAPLLPEHGEGGAETEEEKNYKAAKENGEKMKNAGYLALVTEANALGVLGGSKPGEAKFAGGAQAGIEMLTATPDLSHVVFKSWKAAPGLYEWGPNPKLQLVSRLPDNTPATGSVVLGGLPDVRHAISNIGSRVFWTVHQGLEAALYVRDTQTQETLRLDAATSGPGEGHPAAEFQTASADGSKAFFTDTQRLTADSKATQTPTERADLYVFELNQGKPLSGTLRDLTPEGINGETAAVQRKTGGGGVLGASEDGSYVYFVANGALSTGDETGNCDVSTEEQAPNRKCNLYVRHFNGTEWLPPTLIAQLSNEDAPDWGGSGFPGDLREVTSRVSPNGRYLAFMSNRSLTGYNNVDANPAAKGARDEEVFLYDAGLERLVCASCNPSGAQPSGIFDPGAQSIPGVETEGQGLVVDRLGVWGVLHGKVDHWLAGSVPGWTPISIERSLYQSRYLSDSGRLFFNSPDHLVPAATGVKGKVYQYEPNGVGGCGSNGGCIGLLSSPKAGENEIERESAFLDASENGNDVFFLTAAKLPAVNGVSQDVDSNFDVYDARVCEQGSSSGCLPAPELGHPPCDEVNSACKGAPSPPPSFVAPASRSVSVAESVAGGGTLPSTVTVKPKHLTRAQLLAKALKTCHTKYRKQKKKRTACEAHARRLYGQATKHKRSKKASGGFARRGNR